jgi:hypothetical protein
MSISADLIERAKARDIRSIAEQLGARLRKAAANEYCGPCLGCGGDDRFSINTKKRVWNCRRCGAKGDVIHLVQHIERVSFRDAVERLAGEPWAPAPKPVAPTAGKDDPDYERQQHAKARWLWSRRQPLIGSIAETYLRVARTYKGPLPPTLALLPAYKDHPPCLICAFAPHPGETEPGVLAEPRDVQSVQLIALKPDGSGKADKTDGGIVKRTIGAHKGLPIVVSPPNDLLGLSIHEGVEDALSAYEATGLGCWASGGATFLPALADAVPGTIECVTIGEHKDNSGQNGSRELARRLADRGVDVLLGDGGDG